MRILCTALLTVAASAAQPAWGEPIDATSVHLKLVDQVEVPAQEEGVLSSIEVREGQTVESGQLLAKIASDEVRIARQRAHLEMMIAATKAEDTSAVRAAEEAMRVAESDLNHALTAQQRIPDVLSPTEIAHLQLAVVTAESTLLQAKTELAVQKATQGLRQKDLEFADLKLQRHRLLSPLVGMVVQIHHRPGEWVQSGDQVMRIVRLDELRAEGFIQLENLPRVHDGTPVTVTVSGGDATRDVYRGRVVFLHPEIDPLNRRVRVWANIKNEDLKLRPGMSVKMTLETP